MNLNGNLNEARQNRILDRLLDTSAGQAMAKELDAETRRERQKHVDAIAAIKAKQHKEGPELAAAVEAARDKVKQARAAVAEAEREFAAAYALAGGTGYAAEAEVIRHEAALRLTADERIGEFIDELKRMKGQIRRRGVQAVEQPGKLSILTGKRTVVGHSNAASVREVLAAIATAIDSAEGLKLRIIDDVPAAIARIRGSIPMVQPLGVEVEEKSESAFIRAPESSRRKSKSWQVGPFEWT